MNGKDTGGRSVDARLDDAEARFDEIDRQWSQIVTGAIDDSLETRAAPDTENRPTFERPEA